MKNSIRHGLLCAGATLLALPAAAEESTDANEDIVVIIPQAYQGEFDPREIPQSIGVIDEETLRQNATLRLTDALDLNASVSRQNNFGGLWDSFAVRGFAGDENLPSGYLVNGFNAGRGFGGPRDVAGVERIEILRGPSAALFGRGEPGGTVNIITKQAIFGETRGTASLLAGSFDRYRGDADVNVALADGIAVRLIGFYEDAGSFRDTVDSNRYGFLPQVAARLGEQTTITYDLEWTRAETDFDRGVLAINGELGRIPRSRFLGEPGDGPVSTDVTGHQLQINHEFSDDWRLLIGAGYRETEFSGFSSMAELVGSRQRLTIDGRSLSRQRRFTAYDGEHFVLRGELAGDVEFGGLRHRVLIGADYDEFDNEQTLLRFRPGTAAGQTVASGYIIDVFNPVYGQFPLPAATAVVTDRLNQSKSVGFYVQDQITLTDNLQVRLGVRYDDFDLIIRNRATNTVARRNDSRLSPQVGIVYTASDALTLYAAYGSGFRSNEAITPALEAVAPETSRSYEIGAKLSLFDGALDATVALFNLEKRNVLAADLANPGFSLPIGRARSRGLEIDIAGRLPGDIDMLLSYSYLDAEARADVADPNFSLQIRRGDPLINVPDHSFNLQLSRAWDVMGTELRLGGGVQYVGERLGETATTFTLPDYTLVRLFANWTINEQVELFTTITNLFDETYYTNSFARLWVQPGTPRTATLGARVRF